MTDITANPDPTKLEKIRALLNKAEATEFPEEAEALTTKAVELMERYRIDEAMLADSRPPQDRGKIIEKRIIVGSGPYVNARVMLATNIADCHSVRTLTSLSHKGRLIYFIGYETDVELTEMLYTSLLVQATASLNSPETKRSKPGYVHGTAFGRSFLLAYAATIGSRLQKATRSATDAQTTGRSVALILADRSAAVDDDVLRRYGKIKTSHVAAGSSWAGLTAGAEAAHKADLGTNRRVARQNQNKALCA